MKVILFGATGMVGQGVLRACLADNEVQHVLSVGRAPAPLTHPKLQSVVHADLYDYTALEPQLTAYDACFFCLGVSSAGMKEADYRRVTFDLTLAAATTLARLNPTMTFIYVSGAGTGGRAMWARVKEETENALLALPFKAFMFRPAFIQPMHGIQSRTRAYRMFYAVTSPLYPVLEHMRRWVTTTEHVGLAMLYVAKVGAEDRIIENDEIEALGRRVERG